jgi:hypothetical protein
VDRPAAGARGFWAPRHTGPIPGRSTSNGSRLG